MRSCPDTDIDPMTGYIYWPIKFSFCVFMNRDGVEVNKLAKKKERGQDPTILTKQAWSVKDLLYKFEEIFLPGHGG